MGGQQLVGAPNPVAISGEDFGKIAAAPTTYDAGNALELNGIADTLTQGGFGHSFQDYVSKQIGIYAANQDWANDPEVRSLYIDWIVNPTMSQEEVTAKLQQTGWWKSRTQEQQQYSQSSPADQAKSDQAMAAKLVNDYFQQTGETISVADPQIQAWAHDIASGTTTESVVIETKIRPIALQKPESPWARQLREEHKQEGQYSVDITGTAEKLRQYYQQWGVPPPDGATLTGLATKIVNNELSEADAQKQVQTMAQTLYPWKDPNVDTQTAAQPWLNTYSRVLERPASGIFDPQIQEALNSGTPIYQFEKQLKKRPEWLNTNNAKETMVGIAGKIGQMMGFS
jgi:hypothetical protein